MKKETFEKRRKAHEQKLNFIKDNYEKLCFHEILSHLDCKESTCLSYHYKLGLKPKIKKIPPDERHVMCVDWLNDIPLKKILETYDYPKNLIFKAMEKELWKMKPEHSMYPKVMRLKADHINPKKIWRELDFELYLAKVQNET
jgi:hypothetical protein